MRYMLFVVAACFIGFEGYYLGDIEGRWGENKAVSAALTELPKLPMRIGDWQGTAVKLDHRSTQMAGFSAYALHRYEHRRKGGAVHMLLACGSFGPLSVHTPEVCYQAVGYRPNGTFKKHKPSPSATDEFWTGTFVKQSATETSYLRILWSWSDGARWNAADNARLQFAGRPVLWKLYITQPLSKEHETLPDDDLCSQFLMDAQPILQRIVSCSR